MGGWRGSAVRKGGAWMGAYPPVERNAEVLGEGEAREREKGQAGESEHGVGEIR